MDAPTMRHHRTFVFWQFFGLLALHSFLSPTAPIRTVNERNDPIS